jgi:hypothetical protein
MQLKHREIEKLRKKIYQSYESFLSRERQEKIEFPDFLDNGNLVFWSGNIEINDQTYPGKTYLVGEVVSRETLRGKNRDYSGLIVKTEEGIELFEHYSRRGFRPILVIPGNRGLLANISALERNADHPDLEGKSPQEVIKINFELFPVLIDKLASSSKEDYQVFYLRLLYENPLLY